MSRKFLILLGVIALLPFATYAYVDCRDTINGCSVAQLVEISNKTFLTTQDRISALQQAITMLTAQISALQASGSTNTTTATCVDLNNALVVGSTDATTNGEVSKLQRFLLAAGVYPEGLITGYYGSLTAQAVVRWQKAHGMDFVTAASGVGPMTRGKMKCGSTSANSNSSSLCPAYDSKPVITSITPSLGPVGTTIVVNGCNFLGFESDKVFWFTNDRGVKGIYNAQGINGKLDSSNTSAQITIPSRLCQNMTWYSGLDCTAYLDMTPGTYTLYSNSYGGNSNVVNFTVTAQ